MSDVPLFDSPEPPKVPAAKKTATSGKPTWSKYKPQTPVKCDDCMALYVQGNPYPPLARQATWSRRQGGERRLLCYAHARQWRDYDNLPPLKGPRP